MSVLMEGTKVIGVEEDCPVVRYPNGQLRRLTKEGRVVAPTKRGEDLIVKRSLKWWERKR